MDAGTIFYLGLPLMLLLLGLVAGSTTERRHIRNLERREAALQSMLITDVRTYAADVDPTHRVTMVVGEVAIATDYLKTFLAQLRNVLGGEVKSYLRLVQRARREALLRMIEQARRDGYDAVCNVRLETADIGANTQAKGVPMSALIASGTAYRRRSEVG